MKAIPDATVQYTCVLREFLYHLVLCRPLNQKMAVAIVARTSKQNRRTFSKHHGLGLQLHVVAGSFMNYLVRMCRV